MSRKTNRKYTPESLLSCFAEWEAIQGPGSAVKRDALRRKYGFPNMKTAYVYMSQIRVGQATLLEPNKQPQADVEGGLSDTMIEWLIAAERDLGLDRATVDALMGHWCRYQRREVQA